MSLTPEQLAALRREYSLEPLRRADLEPDPIAQFNRWLAQAVQAEVIEPNGMILSTVDAAQQPWSRTVLLKVCDARGFTFFSNYESDKGHQIAANPQVALTFWWGAMERQINVTGVVSRSTPEESERYFHSRPVSSQLGAWASQQSARVHDRAQLEHQLLEVKTRFADSVIPLPAHWGGFCVSPLSVEFWQGRKNRLHDRLRYTRQAGAEWSLERLSP